jgi:hypothetical protein
MRRAVIVGSTPTPFSSGGGGTLTVLHSSTIVSFPCITPIISPPFKQAYIHLTIAIFPLEVWQADGGYLFKDEMGRTDLFFSL